MGKAKVEDNKSGTDDRAKEAAISVSQPRIAVPATPTRIAIGAALAAFVVSSETCAAESSTRRGRYQLRYFKRLLRK